MTRPVFCRLFKVGDCNLPLFEREKWHFLTSPTLTFRESTALATAEASATPTIDGAGGPRGRRAGMCGLIV